MFGATGHTVIEVRKEGTAYTASMTAKEIRARIPSGEQFACIYYDDTATYSTVMFYLNKVGKSASSSLYFQDMEGNKLVFTSVGSVSYQAKA